MPVLSVTRLRLRSVRYLARFAPGAFASGRQARAAPGFLAGAVLADRGLAFWTLTLWRDGAALDAFVRSGAHRGAMPGLIEWCDEAAVARWDVPEAALPGWHEVDARLRRHGRASRVRHPSPSHATLTHEAPRTLFKGRLTPVGRAG